MTARRNRKAIRTMNQMECRHELRVCVGRGRGERSATAASEALSLPSCIGPDYRRRHFSATRAERAQRGQRTCMPSQTEIRFAHKASEVPHEPKLLSTFGIIFACLVLSAFAQLEKIVIPAGTPEDQGLQAISKEEDAQKKATMYEEFVQKFSSNPAAVAYGNWQLSQYYQGAGDLQKSLDYGDKALVSAPHNLDILVSQVGVAQQMKNNAKTMDYSVRGGEAYNSIGKQTKPAELSDQDFASRIEEEKNASKNSYEFLEAAAYNVIASENDAKSRMSYIERFTPAFRNSRFEEQVTSYAMVSLSELKDTSLLISFGEKTLAANPNSLPALLLLANTYLDDRKLGSVGKSVTYSQKAILVAKADAPTRTSALLKGQDDQQYAIAMYRLGFA